MLHWCADPKARFPYSFVPSLQEELLRILNAKEI